MSFCYWTLLLSLLTFVACQSQLEVEGIWQLDYDGRPKSNFYYHETILLDFEEDSLSIVSIGDPETGNLDTVIIDKHKYHVRDSTIYFEAESLEEIKIHSVTQDSLSLYLFYDDRITVSKRYNELGGNRVFNEDLSKNAFQLFTGEQYINLEFFNDSIVYVSGYQNADKWTIMTFKEYNFLITSNWLLGAFPVSMEDNKIYTHVRRAQVKSELMPLESTGKKAKLVGVWIEYDREPKMPIFQKKDTLQKLTIGMDTINISRFEQSRNFAYNLNFDGSVLYFLPNWDSLVHLSYVPSPPLEILSSTHDELILLQLLRGDSLIIKYNRLN